jgi:uncharacterized protein (TIGR03435 family)
VLKGGPKLGTFHEGSCTPFDPNSLPPAPEPGKPMMIFCGMGHSTNQGFDMKGSTMADLALNLSASGQLDREVIDKTGVRGKFDIHLDLFTPRRNEGSAEPDPADSFAAVQAALGKAGLKLVAGKGPGEFSVIDSVERPSED